jgi:hypothetical protein
MGLHQSFVDPESRRLADRLLSGSVIGSSRPLCDIRPLELNALKLSFKRDDKCGTELKSPTSARDPHRLWSGRVQSRRVLVVIRKTIADRRAACVVGMKMAI